jgi:signal transduction histidine kinase
MQEQDLGGSAQEQFCRSIQRIVGHDLRGPCDSILMSTEILIAQRQDDRALVAMVTRIASFANRMTTMVAQLHDLSRIQLGDGIALTRRKVGLSPLVESLLYELSQQHPDNRFTLIGDAGRNGLWDPDRLRQVITSLAENAVHHGLERGPVTIFLSQDDLVTTIAVHNQVRDAPIPPRGLQQLFELHSERGDDAGIGLGLGLYVARAIVEAHGGEVSAESTTAGTTCRVMLR